MTPVLLLAGVLLGVVPARGRPLGLVPPPDASGPGPDAAALPLRALAGREVWTMDEIRLGIVAGPATAADRDPQCRRPGEVQIALNPSLGLGAVPVAVPASRLLEAEEGRLVLALTPRQIRAAVNTTGCQPR